MTDAADKLFAAVRALMHQPSFGDDSLSGQHERAKLLEAVDEYANRSCPLVEAPELPFTRHNFLVICESHRQLVEELDERNSLLEAKARVYDAVSAWEPEENRNSTSWARVLDALRAVREPGQQRPDACIQSPSSPIDWLLQETEDVGLDRVPTLTRPVWSLAKQLAAEVRRLRELEKTR